MHKFRTTWIISLGLFLVCTSLSFAQSRGRYTRTGAVDLTEEQLLQIGELRLAFQKELLPLRSQLRTGYMELDLLRAKGEEPQKIDAKRAALTELEDEIEKKYVAHDQKIRELLTDEQKVLFDRWGGLGLGLGYGPRWGLDRGLGRSDTWNRGYGRGMGRISGWDRSFVRGTRWARGNARWGGASGRGVRWSRGYARAARPGAGWYCPYGLGTAGRALYRYRRFRWDDE